jgi:predicted DNA repair protein MutK
MASGFFALLDDIASVLDDVATLTKVATKKTAGVLGDDLALNAEQVTGVDATREIPVILAVARGSLVNKAILVPAAMAISAWIPFLIKPLLMIGGAYLCFEGLEKVLHAIWPAAGGEDASDLDAEKKHHAEHLAHLQLSDEELLALEKEKIKGAVRTDFILSAEIIVITLGAVAGVSLVQQVSVLVAISLLITVGVYGLVAGIVKIDDLGLWWMSRFPGTWRARVGSGLLLLAPRLMKFLSVVGTVAMFLVGGGIVVHGVPFLHHMMGTWPWIFGVFGEGLVGMLVGAVVLGVVMVVGQLRRA